MIPRTLFSPEHDTFRASVRRFIQNEIVPYHAEWEELGQVPRELWRKAGAAGSTTNITLGGIVAGTTTINGGSSPRRTRKSVDLPPPFGPSTPIRSPRSSSNVTPSNTGAPPYPAASPVTRTSESLNSARVLL